MVLTEDNDGNSILIFDLSDRSIFADDEWYFGQVEVNTKKVKTIFQTLSLNIFFFNKVQFVYKFFLIRNETF